MSVDPARRRTVAALAAGAFASSRLGHAVEAFFPGPQPGARSAPSRAVVALAHRPGVVLPGGGLAPDLVRSGLGAAVARAAGEETPVDAMRRLFKPTDVVGIKVNCLGGRGVSTHPEVALQLAAFLQAAGVPAERIYVWDRTDRELRAAGFAPSTSGVRVFGTNDAWGDLVEWGPAASRFARVLAEDLTAVISCAVLKDHSLAGVTLSMKNWYGVLHNPNKLHAEGCAPYVAGLSAHPLLRDKLRLAVVDGSLGQCQGGPGPSPNWSWPYGGFLASTDPVALDTVGWRVIEERRRQVGLPTLAADGREPLYLGLAAAQGVGVADPARLETVEV